MRTIILFLLLCLALGVPATPAHAYPARVVEVTDGDSITIETPHGGDRVKVRLHGIDAPELDQPYGQAVKEFVVSAVLFKEVLVRHTRQDTDRDGRVVAVVDIAGLGNLQGMLLEAGLAWVWPKYCRDCKDWEAMQAAAKSQKRGLWADENPVPPWRWRLEKGGAKPVEQGR